MATVKIGSFFALALVSFAAFGCGRTDEPRLADASDTGRRQDVAQPGSAEVAGADARSDVADAPADGVPNEAPSASDLRLQQNPEVAGDTPVGLDTAIDGIDAPSDRWVIDGDVPPVDLRDGKPGDVASEPHPEVAPEVAPDIAADFVPMDTRSPDADGTQCVYKHAAGSFYVPKVFDFSVIEPDGFTLSCSTRFDADGGSPYWPGPQTGRISGMVVAVAASEIQVDTCPVGGVCSPTIYRFTPTAPGLTLPSIPPGRQVAVSWWLYYGGFSCGRMLVVSDDASSDAGTQGPAALWLAGMDSTLTAQLALPFSFTRQELNCNPDPSSSQGCGGNDVPPDDYAFVFAPQTGEPAIVLATGQSGTLAITLGSSAIQHLKLLTLRCFMTGACDDYSNWAWWATGHAGANGDPD